jgi:hypothetical protein
MAPKMSNTVRNLVVLNESSGETINLAVQASDTFGAVKAKIHEAAGIPTKSQKLYHNGRQQEDSSKIAAKPSILLRLFFDKSIESCTLESELNNFTQPELHARSLQLGLEIAKTSAKSTIVLALVQRFKDTAASMDSGEIIDQLKERIRVLESQVEQQANKQIKSDHEPKANTNHQAAEDSESTSWWTNEQPTQQVQTDKQPNNNNKTKPTEHTIRQRLTSRLPSWSRRT